MPTKNKRLSYTHVTEDNFKAIKNLLEALKATKVKSPISEVKRSTHRSYQTIYYIDKSETFSEYKEKVSELNLRKKGAKVANVLRESVKEGNAALFEAAEEAANAKIDEAVSEGDPVKMVEAMHELVTEIRLFRNDMKTARHEKGRGIFSRG